MENPGILTYGNNIFIQIDNPDIYIHTGVLGKLRLKLKTYDQVMEYTDGKAEKAERLEAIVPKPESPEAIDEADRIHEQAMSEIRRHKHEGM